MAYHDFGITDGNRLSRSVTYIFDPKSTYSVGKISLCFVSAVTGYKYSGISLIRLPSGLETLVGLTGLSNRKTDK